MLFQPHTAFPTSAAPVPAPADPLGQLAALRRPPLLVQAARYGLPEYQRPRALRRLLGRVPPPGTGLLAELLAIEQALNDARAAGAATWRPSDQIEALIAVMAEGRTLAAMTAPV